MNHSIKDVLKKHLYVMYSEKYVNASNNTFIERYVAKHPMLKPEFIVINDQVQGFKKISKKIRSLEEFPIYLEVEGILNDDNTYIIDSVDLYTESSINCQPYLKEIIYITSLFKEFVILERNIDVSNPKEETLVITSKIQELLFNITQDDHDIDPIEEIDDLMNVDDIDQDMIKNIEEKRIR